jgi:hypothetical protein
MENQILYWEIENYTSSSFSLMQEGEKIFSTKLTIKEVEKHIGKKLKVCPAHENPHFIIGARVEENSRKMIDRRARLRGTTQKYYILLK